MYMLDTNICIFIIKKRPLPIFEKLEKISGEQVCLSVVTFAELVYGVERSSSKKLNQEVLDDFISNLLVLPWDTEAARQYGKIRTYLEKIGTPIGNMDLLIAAHALSGKQILVTNNLREFKRVPYLKCVDWTR
jgi:tRNA(fMet)-specific endonuclease VapC